MTVAEAPAFTRAVARDELGLDPSLLVGVELHREHREAGDVTALTLAAQLARGFGGDAFLKYLGDYPVFTYRDGTLVADRGWAAARPELAACLGDGVTTEPPPRRTVGVARPSAAPGRHPDARTVLVGRLTVDVPGPTAFAPGTGGGTHDDVQLAERPWPVALPADGPERDAARERAWADRVEASAPRRTRRRPSGAHPEGDAGTFVGTHEADSGRLPWTRAVLHRDPTFDFLVRWEVVADVGPARARRRGTSVRGGRRRRAPAHPST